ncbi:hypothetical protein WG834_004916 [Escherichia coli]|jgi:hypothetical protein|uniref:toxin YdaT family protein n=1 Tax=Escherichia coli TaxID=562 RepID=UPI000390C87F|nr:toxin YdaT family protein [Escherichia coli]EFY4555973.1 hypothetical protein [Shigella boydii]EEC7950011.1 hypothetical protein [Escherichia coli]EEC8423335.1 hypothetical protein [Escherichia coli]EEQ2048264.1 hypothetical protein [Escherichia coli]EEQ3553763.1 hypothetical protein [Escherichia coli]
MKIKHEHIRMAMNAWLLYPRVGRKKIADDIATAYFELGMTYPPMHDASTTEGIGLNIQNIFRWIEKDTPDAVEKIQALIPAILTVLPRELRYHLSIFDTVERRALLAAQEALSTAIDAHDDAVQAVYRKAYFSDGGSSGESVVVH